MDIEKLLKSLYSTECNINKSRINKIKIIFDFDGTLVSTNIYFSKYKHLFKIMSLLYLIYETKLKKYVGYKMVRKFLELFTNFISNKVCREYIKDSNSKQEISLLLSYLRKLKEKDLQIFILSQSKTADYLYLTKKFGELGIPYFWVGQEKRSYLDIICREGKCIFISDNEKENTISNLKNVIYIKINNPKETYKFLDEILMKFEKEK